MAGRTIIAIGILSAVLVAHQSAKKLVRPSSNEPPQLSQQTVQTIDWDDSLSILDLALLVGDTVKLYCPPDGSLGASVWGTDVYTDDSSVCVAAVHAGLINERTGGETTIRVMEGQASYEGSTRHEVISADYDEWGVSFQFVR